jgi:hypothetical protein
VTSQDPRHVGKPMKAHKKSGGKPQPESVAAAKRPPLNAIDAIVTQGPQDGAQRALLRRHHERRAAFVRQIARGISSKHAALFLEQAMKEADLNEADLWRALANRHLDESTKRKSMLEERVRLIAWCASPRPPLEQPQPHTRQKRGKPKKRSRKAGMQGGAPTPPLPRGQGQTRKPGSRRGPR